VITAAAVCPWPPLLARELTGRSPVVPELRKACEEAVQRLAATQPSLIAVVGPADATRTWDPRCRLDASVFAPALRSEMGAASERELPPSLGLGALLLDQAGYTGPRFLQAVAEDEPPLRCASLGEATARSGGGVGLLVMGDGSARRSARAPGYFDDRAAGFDAETERALREADLSALLAIDPVLARELLASGRPAWQVMAGAMAPAAPVFSDILYCDDPFGVAYVVAFLASGALAVER
jgi:hypothetical protein